MESFGKLQNLSIKNNQSNVVTQADIDSERIIVKTIRKNYPSHNIIAEESGYIDNNSAFTWIIDPLDGTSNYAAGLPWFGTMVALLKDNIPIIAGIYLPYYDLMYFAEKGKEAQVNNTPIKVTDEKELKNVLVAYSLDFSEDSTKTASEARIIQNLVGKIRNLRATNSVAEFCYVADGRLGGCINQTAKIWDIVAPTLLIEEAGGTVTTISGNQHEFKTTRENYLDNYTIVAATKTLHPKLMGIVKSSAVKPS
ncbi:MAG: inositol monophosphatase [Candidatus Woesearchaeota archaeon]